MKRKVYVNQIMDNAKYSQQTLFEADFFVLPFSIKGKALAYVQVWVKVLKIKTKVFYL